MSTTTEAPRALRPAAAPRLRVRNAARAIEFYRNAFGARELFRFEVHGSIPHAEIAIGDSVIMLGEEGPDYPGPQTLGGSPVTIQLSVDDVDAAVARAVDAGADIIMPVQNQFYGERAGTVLDPFGYPWSISMQLEDLSLEEMHRRLEGIEKQQQSSSPVPAGYQTVTPYLVSTNAADLIDFVKQTFGAQETFRTIGSAGGIHCELRFGDSMLMIGGGGPDLTWKGESVTSALHVYVEDVDGIYQRALKAGAESIAEPMDQEYGERSASVRDRHGNNWYIATAKGERYIPEGLRSLNPYLHPLRGETLIRFLERGLGARELARYATPDGVIHHAKIKLGDSVIEFGEAHGQYQPKPAMFYVYVSDVDAAYTRSLRAGAVSISEPKDQTYGDRTAAIKDPFGNQWYLATHLKRATP